VVALNFSAAYTPSSLNHTHCCCAAPLRATPQGLRRRPRLPGHTLPRHPLLGALPARRRHGRCAARPWTVSRPGPAARPQRVPHGATPALTVCSAAPETFHIRAVSSLIPPASFLSGLPIARAPHLPPPLPPHVPVVHALAILVGGDGMHTAAISTSSTTSSSPCTAHWWRCLVRPTSRSLLSSMTPSPTTASSRTPWVGWRTPPLSPFPSLLSSSVIRTAAILYCLSSHSLLFHLDSQRTAMWALWSARYAYDHASPGHAALLSQPRDVHSRHQADLRKRAPLQSGLFIWQILRMGDEAILVFVDFATVLSGSCLQANTVYYRHANELERTLDEKIEALKPWPVFEASRTPSASAPIPHAVGPPLVRPSPPPPPSQRMVGKGLPPSHSSVFPASISPEEGENK